MSILTAFLYSLVGGTFLGLAMYAWDRLQERRQAKALSEINKRS